MSPVRPASPSLPNKPHLVILSLFLSLRVYEICTTPNFYSALSSNILFYMFLFHISATHEVSRNNFNVSLIVLLKFTIWKVLPMSLDENSGRLLPLLNDSYVAKVLLLL